MTPDRMPSSSLPVPDLLCHTAAVRVDVTVLRQALVFAFATGGAQDVFDDETAKASLPSSSFQRAGFGRDLYLDEIVDKALGVRIAGKLHRTCPRYVARVIASPPDDLRDVDLRRGVLAELLALPLARSELERIYESILRLRALLCAARQPSPRARRIEILRAARETFALLGASFGGCTSALARVREFGALVVSGEGYRRLVAFLEHEEHQGSLELRVRVDSDGEVRAMQILRIDDNRANPFYVSLFRRWLTRLALVVRAYRTTGGEIAERLLSDVFAPIEGPVAILFQLLGDIEVHLGALCFRDRAVEVGLSAVLPTLAPEGAPFSIVGLFNPLLLASSVSPVPCDVRAGSNAIVLVTGPNSGGKTRFLQAVATAQIFAQVGLFVPAALATIPLASGLFASLFEEARADQPEGHLGMELLRIRRLFDQMGPGGLVVIDELCSGTNPSEGEEISRLVLSLLPELGVRGFVTTHLLPFAQRLAVEAVEAVNELRAPLEFLQVELDASERSTYRFVSGVARTSLAHKTAARLGVTREELRERIAARRVATSR